MQVKKDEKERKEKFNSKTMCTHSKWANKQTLKTGPHPSLTEGGGKGKCEHPYYLCLAFV